MAEPILISIPVLTDTTQYQEVPIDNKPEDAVVVEEIHKVSETSEPTTDSCSTVAMLPENCLEEGGEINMTKPETGCWGWCCWCWDSK